MGTTVRDTDIIHATFVAVSSNSATTIYTTRSIPTGATQYIQVALVSDVSTTPSNAAGSVYNTCLAKNVAGTVTVVASGTAVTLKDSTMTLTLTFTVSGTTILVQITEAATTPNEHWTAVGFVWTNHN